MLPALRQWLGGLLGAQAHQPRRAARSRRAPSADAAQLAFDLTAPALGTRARPTTGTTAARARALQAVALLERLNALGLSGIRGLRLTGNRTILVSWQRSQLRVHQGFAAAPDDVVSAIVRFVRAVTGDERAEAVRVLRSFPIAIERARHPRRQATATDDRALAERLTAMHRELNTRCFGGTLGLIEVVVSRRMKTRLGHYALAWPGAPGQIAVSRRHLKRHGWAQAAETLLHEMIHQWQDETAQVVDHGRGFRRKARELGITAAAKRAV